MSRMKIFISVIALSALIMPTAVSAQDLIRLIQAGDTERAAGMLKADPSLALTTDGEGSTPLHFAAFGGRIELIDLLLSLGAELDAENADGQTALLYAAYGGMEEACEALITRGARFDYRDVRGNSPLLFAARQGHPRVVELLIEKGANVSARGAGGRTPLYQAAAAGQLDIVRMLEEAGADPGEADEEGTVPLIAALRSGRGKVALYLAAKGGMDGFTRSQYEEVLHGAAVTGMTDMAVRAMEMGASLDSKGPGGASFLHSAVRGGAVKLVRMALRSGAEVDARDPSGRTALHLAAASGRKDIVSILLKRGADPEARTKSEDTPYIIADNGCYEDVLKLLVKNGARAAGPKPYAIEGRKGSSPVEVRYIANEGFIIAGRQGKVMIDALIDNPFGYSNTGERVLGMMGEGRGPFEEVDVDIASHNHADHFDPGMTIGYLEAQEGVVFIGNEAVCDALRAEAGDSEAVLSGRVFETAPEWGEKTAVTIGGIGFSFFQVAHSPPGAEPYPTLETLVEIDGMRFLHLADVVAESSEEWIRRGLQGERVDVAFLDRFFLEDSIGSMLVEEVIRPQYIILMHLRPGEEEPASEALQGDHPGLLVFRGQLERKIFE